MLIYLLLVISFLLRLLNSGLNKQFQLGFTIDLPHFASYNLLNAVFASVYFFIGSGFRIQMNLVTLLYSMGYGLIVILSLIIGILALSKLSISFSGIVSTAGSTILSTVFGILIFKEAASLRLFVSILLMFLALLIPCGRIWSSGKRGSLIICILSFFNAGASVLIQKFYTVTPGVCDTNSFFFMTNLCIVVFCAVLLFIIAIRRPEGRKILLRSFTLKQTANIACRTLLSNISSVITIVLLANMNVSVYTVINSSLSIISGAVLSKIIFKEKMPYQNWIAVALAICAIVVSP